MSIPPFDESGIAIVPLSEKGRELIGQIKEIIETVFGRPIDPCVLDLSGDDYFRLVLDAQNQINELELIARIFEHDGTVLRRAIGGLKPAAQRIAHFRAVRPQKSGRNESVGFHRESFFNADMTRAWNVWIAVRDVFPENCVKYVPKSQLIPESEIVTRNEGAQAGLVARNSEGHRVGLLYDPLTIVSGVNFADLETMYVPEDHMAVFDSNLIHGGGANLTDLIRFSIDFRFIAMEHVYNFEYNLAADGPYFASLG